MAIPRNVTVKKCGCVFLCIVITCVSLDTRSLPNADNNELNLSDTSSFWYVVTAIKVVSANTYVEHETLTPSSVSSTT